MTCTLRYQRISNRIGYRETLPKIEATTSTKGERRKPQEAQSAKEESHDEEKPQDHTISVATEPVHLLDHLRTRMLHGQGYIHGGKVGKINQNIQNIQEWQSNRNVQELKTAGIHLKRGKNCYLSKIKFTKTISFSWTTSPSSNCYG